MHCFLFFTRSSSNRWGLFEIDHINCLCSESELFLHIALLSREQSPVTVIISTEQKIRPPLPDLFFQCLSIVTKNNCMVIGKKPQSCVHWATKQWPTDQNEQWPPFFNTTFVWFSDHKWAVPQNQEHHEIRAVAVLQTELSPKCQHLAGTMMAVVIIEWTYPKCVRLTSTVSVMTRAGVNVPSERQVGLSSWAK